MKHRNNYQMLRKLKRLEMIQESRYASYPPMAFIHFDFKQKKYFCVAFNKLIATGSTIEKCIDDVLKFYRITDKNKISFFYNDEINLIDFDFDNSIDYWKNNTESARIDFEQWKKEISSTDEYISECEKSDYARLSTFDTSQARSPQWQENFLQNCRSEKYKNAVLKDGLLNVFFDVKAKEELEFKRQRKQSI